MPFVIVLLTCLGQVSLTTQSSQQPPLRISIDAPQHEGCLQLDCGMAFKAFHIIVTNVSASSVRLWHPKSQPGLTMFTFELEASGEKQIHVSRSLPKIPPQEWLELPPAFVTIAPGASRPFRIELGSTFWGSTWKNVPEPNAGTKFRMTARLKINVTEQTQARSIWTGEVDSAPVTAQVINKALTTPRGYMVAGWPARALAMLREDPSLVSAQLLQVASESNHLEVAEWLLRNGADVNATGSYQLRALHHAESPAMVRLLIKHGAEVDAVDKGKTALQRAALDFAHYERTPALAGDAVKMLSVAKALLDSGARYDLRSACLLNDLERIRQLLSSKRPILNDGEAFREAVAYGREKIVRAFLEAGVGRKDIADSIELAVGHPGALRLLLDPPSGSPKVKLGSDDSYLLHRAASVGAVESVKILLDRGLIIDQPDEEGRTPLAIAAKNGRVEAVELLLARKANPEGARGIRPIVLAAEDVWLEKWEENRRLITTIRALERAGAKPTIFTAIACGDERQAGAILASVSPSLTAKTTDGHSALQFAICLGHTGIVRQLLEKGADPNARDQSEGGSNGSSPPLHEAAFCGRREEAGLLIKFGARIHERDRNGATALHEAARLGQPELVEFLLKSGADPGAKDKEGQTPLDYARMHHEALEPEVVDVLTKPSRASHPK